MNYGAGEIKNVDGGNVSFNVGIQKTTLKEVLFESAKQDGSGDKVLTIVFTNSSGAEEKLRIWKINDEQVKTSPIVNAPIKYKSTINYGGKEYKYEVGKPLTPELALVKAYFDLDVKVKHIISKFTEDTNLEGVTSYETFAKAVRDKLKPFYNTEVEGLFEYDKKNYVHLYSKVPFLQKIGDNILEKSKTKAKLTLSEVPAPDAEEIPSSSSSSEEWN